VIALETLVWAVWNIGVGVVHRSNGATLQVVARLEVFSKFGRCSRRQRRSFWTKVRENANNDNFPGIPISETEEDNSEADIHRF
jgi:hypothetical protein